MDFQWIFNASDSDLIHKKSLVRSRTNLAVVRNRKRNPTLWDLESTTGWDFEQTAIVAMESLNQEYLGASWLKALSESHKPSQVATTESCLCVSLEHDATMFLVIDGHSLWFSQPSSKIWRWHIDPLVWWLEPRAALCWQLYIWPWPPVPHGSCIGFVEKGI